MDIFDTEYYKINKFFLSFLGLWPYQASFIRTVKSSLAAVGVVVMCAPMLMFVYKHSDDMDRLLELMPTMVGTLTCGMKFSSLLYNFEKFESLLRQIRNDWSNISIETERIFKKYTKITWRFTALYAFMVVSFVTCFASLPLVNPFLDIISPFNETRPRKLVHPAEFLVDQEKHFFTLLIIMYYGYIVTIAIVVGIDTTYFITIEHTCALFGVLSYHLENTIVNRAEREVDRNSSSKQDDVVRHLVRCIRLHIKIKAFIELIETTFMIFLCLEICLGFVMHCTLCVMIVLRINQSTEVVIYIALVICQSSRLFFHGWSGQQVTDHNIEVYIAAYNAPWYEMSKRAKKILLMVIAKSQMINEVTVAKAFIVNLEFFSVIMKTSLSYCTVILSAREGVNGNQ